MSNYNLFKELKSGDLEAKEKIFNNNVKLVTYTLKKITKQFDDDLFQDGCIGLLKAINTFDIDKGYKFTTYASMCIRNQIYMSGRKCIKINKEISLNKQLNIKLGEEPMELVDFIDDKKPNILDVMIDSQELSSIYECINNFNNVDKKIIELYFGLNNNLRKTQKEIGDIYNRSQTYINRIIKRCINDIKKELNVEDNRGE